MNKVTSLESHRPVISDNVRRLQVVAALLACARELTDNDAQASDVLVYAGNKAYVASIGEDPEAPDVE